MLSEEEMDFIAPQVCTPVPSLHATLRRALSALLLPACHFCLLAACAPASTLSSVLCLHSCPCLGPCHTPHGSGMLQDLRAGEGAAHVVPWHLDPEAAPAWLTPSNLGAKQ